MTLPASLRYTLRRATNARGLALVLIAALALGLGGATAMLALADRALVNPLGLVQPQQMIHIADSPDPATAAAYAQLPALTAVAAYAFGPLRAAAGSAAGTSNIAAVTQGFFRTAAAVPRFGRPFSSRELQAGDRVAIIGQALAERGFGDARAALGRTVALGGTAFTIIGVMSSGFFFPRGASVWVPFNAAQNSALLLSGETLIARMRPDVSFAVANAQVAAYQRHEAAVWDAAHPQGPKMGVSYDAAIPLARSWSDQYHSTVELLLAAAGLLWLVACFNLGGVLLARSLNGQKDTATRIALGAGRRRLVRYWLAEALMLVIPGAVVGWGVAVAAMAALRHWAPPDLPGLPRLHPAWLDAAVLAALAVLTLLLVALAPMLRALRQRSPAELMQSAFHPIGTARVRSSLLWPVLVTVELAAALALTAGAGLLLATYGNLMQVDLGFSAAGVQSLQYASVPALQTGAALSRSASEAAQQQAMQQAAAQMSRLSAQVLAAVARQPGVEAAITSRPPLLAQPGGQQILSAPGDFRHTGEAATSDIGGRYFRLLAVPLLRGRYFNTGDTAAAPPVAIVSRRLAHSLWGASDPLGRPIIVGGGPHSRLRTVVGEVADVVAAGPGQRSIFQGQVYLPFAQPYRGAPLPVATLLLRTPGSIRPLDAAVSSLPGIEVVATSSFADAVARITAGQRFSALVIALFSGLALVLVWLGVLGLLAHWVAGRRHEMAIRLALGALPAALARTVLGRVGLMLAAAVGLALLASPLEKSLIAHMLFGVQALDLRLWTAAAVLVCAVAFAAAAIPALRAARVQPGATLRHE